MKNDGCREKTMRKRWMGGRGEDDEIKETKGR